MLTAQYYLPPDVSKCGAAPLIPALTFLIALGTVVQCGDLRHWSMCSILTPALRVLMSLAQTVLSVMVKRSQIEAEKKKKQLEEKRD